MDGFWQRQSPVLFPIVGALRRGKYQYEDQEYSLPQHGFARDMEWSMIEQGRDAITLVLEDTEVTRMQYPFVFRLEITYQLLENGLLVEYFLVNPSSEKILHASLGAHPAFHLEGDISEYSFHFPGVDAIVATSLDHGLLSGKQESFPLHDGTLLLSESLFSHDALIFQTLDTTRVELYRGAERVLTLDRENFPLLAIWKQLNAPFLCIEPWAGHADPLGENTLSLLEKPAMIHLDPNDTISYTWSLTF